MQPQAAPTAPAPLRTYPSAEAFLASGRDALSKGPVALIFVEDHTELASTILHHQNMGFREVLVFAPGWIELPEGMGAPLRHITYDTLAEHAVQHAINAVTAAAAEGVWLYYCYNAEYLFFPFCETRKITELIAFHTEERRDAFLTYVVDLYAGDLARFPDAVSIENAHLDRS